MSTNMVKMLFSPKNTAKKGGRERERCSNRKKSKFNHETTTLLKALRGRERETKVEMFIFASPFRVGVRKK